MKILLRKIFRNECGATAIEYGLLIGCIGMAMTFGMKVFVDAFQNMYEVVNENTANKVK